MKYWSNNPNISTHNCCKVIKESFKYCTTLFDNLLHDIFYWNKSQNFKLSWSKIICVNIPQFLQREFVQKLEHPTLRTHLQQLMREWCKEWSDLEFYGKERKGGNCHTPLNKMIYCKILYVSKHDCQVATGEQEDKSRDYQRIQGVQ